jgi:hypothetical protein
MGKQTRGLTCDNGIIAGRRDPAAFLDAEEVRGSNPLAPTKKARSETFAVPAFEVRGRYAPVERDPLRARDAEDRFVPVRFDVDDVDRFPAGAVLSLLFVAAVFRAEDFLADDDRAGDFLAGDFLARVFFDDVLAIEGRFAVGLFDEDDFFAFCLRSRARAAPPTAAPSAAAPVAASIGFSATVLATFFAPDPTADTASPALSTTVEIGERPSFASSLRFVSRVRAMCPPLGH